MNNDYISGYFDGEGTLGVEYGVYKTGVNEGKSRVGFRIGIKSGDVEILKAIAAIYGGNLQKVQLQDSWRVVLYQWRLSGNKAFAFLSSLKCVSKQPQIDAWLDGWNKYTKEKDKGLKLKIAMKTSEQIKELKRWNYREDK